MLKQHADPKTLSDAIRYFADADRSLAFVVQLRWPSGVICPHCEADKPSFLRSRRIWKCRACRKQFSVKVGTVFEDSALGLDKWLPALWMLANCKNGISSYELARALGVTQKSAWFMLHRIRLAMQTGSFDKFSGEVEVDETYIGGLARNMHRAERKRKITGTGGHNKAKVVGMIERESGAVRLRHVEKIDSHTLHGFIHEGVETGSDLYTDTHRAYSGLDADYWHEVVDHIEKYVDGRVHTNGMENFWSLLKRGLHGTYISVQPFHLFRYLDERCFTFNERNLTDLGRFSAVLGNIANRRLTYLELTGKA